MRSPADGRITYGYYWWHQAIDIARNTWQQSYRSPIYAPEKGKVTFVGNMGWGVANAGLVVEVSAGNRVHRLCHLNKSLVKVGQSVKEGQHIAEMGHSGYTIPSGKEGTHLHWVMFVAGKRVNPSKYVTVSQPKPIKPAPKPPAQKAYLIVRAGEGLSHLAKRAGYKDWTEPKRWQAITNLNKIGWTWQRYNDSLKSRMKVRVK